MIKSNHLKLFETYLRSLNLFKEEEIQFISERTRLKRFKKNEFFIKEGEKCEDFLFITKGIFRSFFCPNQSTSITHGFTFENNFLTSLSSYLTGEESEENIQSIVNSEAIVLSKAELTILEEQHLSWNKFLKIYSEKQFSRMEKIIRIIYQEDAETRYMNLIKHQPHYFQQLPLNHIASYLGITQRHLSRIRKGIMTKEKKMILVEKQAQNIIN